MIAIGTTVTAVEVRWICIFVLNIRPNNEPITREQEIMWDYLAAKNNHK